MENLVWWPGGGGSAQPREKTPNHPPQRQHRNPQPRQRPNPREPQRRPIPGLRLRQEHRTHRHIIRPRRRPNLGRRMRRNPDHHSRPQDRPRRPNIPPGRQMNPPSPHRPRRRNIPMDHHTGAMAPPHRHHPRQQRQPFRRRQILLPHAEPPPPGRERRLRHPRQVPSGRLPAIGDDQQGWVREGQGSKTRGRCPTPTPSRSGPTRGSKGQPLAGGQGGQRPPGLAPRPPRPHPPINPNCGLDGSASARRGMRPAR